MQRCGQIVMNDKASEWGRQERVAYDAGQAEATWTVAVDTAGYHVLSKGKEVHVFKHRRPWSTFAEVEAVENATVEERAEKRRGGELASLEEAQSEQGQTDQDDTRMTHVGVRVDTLKQPTPTLEALDIELRREFADKVKTTGPALAQSLPWTPTYSKRIEQAIQNIDLETAVAQQHQALTIESGPDPLNTRRLRVVIVLMDGHISSSEKALQQFRAAIAARLAVIAVLLPGYVVTNYSCWYTSNASQRGGCGCGRSRQRGRVRERETLHLEV
jgi:hypothetical protein